VTQFIFSGGRTDKGEPDVNQYISRFAAPLLIILLVTGCSNLPKRSADFDQASKDMKELAVLPATFQLQELGAFSSEMVTEMNYDIERMIVEATKAVINESQVRVANFDIDDNTLSANPQLRRAIYDHTNAISEARMAIAETDGKVIDVQYDGDIDVFADLADCDCLVCLEGDGYFKTGGAKAKEAAVGAIFAILFGSQSVNDPDSATKLSAYIIDANRGRVVWYNEKTRSGADPRKRTHILKTVQDVFKPLFGKSKLKWDDDRDDEIIDKYEEEMEQQEEGNVEG
jgi:hypothetical protein